MRADEIVAFVKQNIEPLHDAPYGERYRVAATMIDGTPLPCVVVASASKRTELALRRFDQTKASDDRGAEYREIVRTFVTQASSVNDFNLQVVTRSSHAIPLARLREIGGETSMAWTEFTAIMGDGKEFRFGTSFHTEFFEMPPGYSAADIAKIVPAIRGERTREGQIYREKPFFTCFIDGL